jgi:transposase
MPIPCDWNRNDLMMTDIVFGVDVAKRWVDVVGPAGHERITNAGLDGFAARVASVGGRVVFEASGGCEAALRAALGRAGVAAQRVNPARARCFARAIGRLAKTDRVDAGVLREMGLRLTLPLCPPETEERRKLKALQLRRRQLVEDAKREKTRISQTDDPDMRGSVGRVLALFRAEIATLEAQIRELIGACPELAARVRLLRSAPGIGPVAATALVTGLEELGTLTPGQSAALLGVAPMASDSGTRQRKRHIRGGRKALRDVLYMSALSAARHDPGLRSFAERLKARGLAPKQAIIAVARKLIIILNAMIRENRPYKPA